MLRAVSASSSIADYDGRDPSDRWREAAGGELLSAFTDIVLMPTPAELAVAEPEERG